MTTTLRFVAIPLVVVLAALVTLLAMPLWSGRHVDEAAGHTAAMSASASAERPVSPTPAKAQLLLQRVTFILGASALVLTVTLFLTQVLRPHRATYSRQPFSATRTEVGALARLAESSVAQGEEL